MQRHKWRQARAGPQEEAGKASGASGWRRRTDSPAGQEDL
jgi:hypothetical protein